MFQNMSESRCFWLIVLLSWIVTLSTIATASSCVAVRDRQLRAEYQNREGQLRTHITKLEDRLVEVSVRNKAHRRLLVLAGYLSEAQSSPAFVTDAPENYAVAKHATEHSR